MALADQYNLSTNQLFLQRLQGAMVHAAIAVINEVVNEAHTLTFTGTVTGGTFTLTYAGQVTPALPWNSSAAAVAAAIQALSTIGNGNVVVTGGPGPTAFVVTFCGTLGASPHSLIVAGAGSLTGTTPGMTVTRSTNGVGTVNHAPRAALASKILQNPTGYAQLMALGVADSATVQADWPGPTYAPVGGTVDTDIQNQVSAIFNSYS